MKETRLSTAQLAFLRQQPLGDSKNKVGLALGLLQITQAEFSEATKIAQPDLSDIRNGKYSRVYLHVAQQIAIALGASTDDVFPPTTHAFAVPKRKPSGAAKAKQRRKGNHGQKRGPRAEQVAA